MKTPLQLYRKYREEAKARKVERQAKLIALEIGLERVLYNEVRRSRFPASPEAEFHLRNIRTLQAKYKGLTGQFYVLPIREYERFVESAHITADELREAR